MARRVVYFIPLVLFSFLLVNRALGAPVNYFANLTPLNNSGVTGTASLTLNGNDLTVVLNAVGLEPDKLHPQHIHGFVDGRQSSLHATDFNANGMIDDFEA